MALPKYLKIFDIRVQELRDGSKKPKVVFNKGIEVFFNGEKVDLGQYSGGFLTKTQDAIAQLEKSVEAGKLDEDYAQKQIDYLLDNNLKENQNPKNISSVFEVSTVKKG